jgi:Predicted membrane protein (DUF2232)
MNIPDAQATSPLPLGRFEIPLAGLGAVAAFSIFFALPVAGAIGLPLAAVPLVRLAHRRGLINGLLGCALASALVLGIGWAGGGLASGFAMAALCAGVTVLPTSTVGFLRAGVDASRCYLGLCLAGCAFLGAAFAASAGRPGPSISAEVAAAFDSWIPSFIESYARQGADAEAVARMRLTLESGREFAREFLWGIFGGLWIVGAAIGFYAGAWAARPAPTAEAARFEALHVPAQAAAFFVAAGAVFGLVPGVGRRIAGNLMLPLGALFFVAGLSIICHFLRRWLRTRILRAGLYALAVYFPINVGVALLGLFDWYVDFRRRGGEGTERS